SIAILGVPISSALYLGVYKAPSYPSLGACQQSPCGNGRRGPPPGGGGAPKPWPSRPPAPLLPLGGASARREPLGELSPRVALVDHSGASPPLRREEEDLLQELLHRRSQRPG